MKSYTDLEQSKKLAKILPTESADMYYCYGMDLHTKKWDYDIVPTIIDASNQIDIGDIPCWSLAALLEILPIDFVQYKHYFLEVSKMGDVSKPYEIRYYRFREDWEGADYGRITHISYTAGNLIDACVAMIEWLHEQKLLRL